MKNITACIILLVATFYLSGCSSILSPKKQKATFNTGNSKASVYIDNDSVGAGEIVVGKLKKDLRCKQIKIEAPGYKPTYYAAIQCKKNPAVYPSFLFGFYPYPLDLLSSKSYLYHKSFDCPPITKRILRQGNQKYINIEDVKFDVKKKDFRYEHIPYGNYVNKIEKADARYEKKKAKEKNKKDDGSDDIKVDNSIFSYQMEKVLKATGFIDTLNEVFQDISNSLLLTANIKSLTFYEIEVEESYFHGKLSFKICKSDIKWDLLNSYGEIMKSVTVKSQSGEFAVSDTSLDKMLADMVENSLNQVLKNNTLLPLVQMDKPGSEVKLSLSSITKPTSLITTSGDAQNATVIVKTNKGHGSGFAISNDGYIITNYHVIAGEDEKKPADATVILYDGSKVKATIVKYNKSRDIAILKVDNKFEKCFAVPSQKNFTPLEEIYVMGAPKSIELGQSASKGIISSERNINNVNVIQTNISVSPGNSGGPMFNKDGKLYGVVVSKLVGAFAEGVAFCIPAYRITEYLNIEFK